MATSVICDLCEKAPSLGKVRVTVEVEGAVFAGKVTGRMEELDCCLGCRGKAIAKVYGLAAKILQEHIPAQNELLDLKEQITVLRTERTKVANSVGELEKALLDAARQPASEGEALEQMKTAMKAIVARIEEYRVALEKIDAQLNPLKARRHALLEATK